MVIQKKSYTFALAKFQVPWMSGLVNGLQNRLRRFESARHLRRKIPKPADYQGFGISFFSHFQMLLHLNGALCLYAPVLQIGEPRLFGVETKLLFG